MGMGYSSLCVDVKSISDIYVAVSKFLNEFPEEEKWEMVNLSGNEIHATLMYDKRDPEIDPGINNTVYTANVIGFEKMGNPNGNYYALALVLESDAIQRRFKELQELGFEHSFPELKLHISLNYGSSTEIGYRILNKMWEKDLFPKTIKLCRETWNKCKV
ncbi:nuclease [Aeromonas phage AerS_266]|nr:nuclease [Aeromonas phage AerS_266]